MSLKEKFENKKGMTFLIAGAVLAAGIGTMAYSVQSDKSAQDRKASQVVETLQPQVSALADKKTNAEVMQASSQMESVDMAQVKVLVSGKAPEGITLKAEAAAQKGLSEIMQETGNKPEGCSVEMNFIDYSGTTEKGYWKGKALLSDTLSYEFKVNSSTGEVTDCTAYTRKAQGQGWEGNGSQKIEENDLPSYSKIQVDLISDIVCKIVPDEHYSLNMERKSTDYTISYEIKDDTLHIKETGRNSRNDGYGWNCGSDCLVIGVPQGNTLEEITSASSNFGLTVENINCNKLNLKQDNHSINIEDSQLQNVNISGVNGSIEISGGSIASCQIEEQNGSFNIDNVTISDGSFKAENGSLNFGKGVKGKIKAEADNGEVCIADKKSDQNCKYEVSVTNGSISWDGKADDYEAGDSWMDTMNDWMTFDFE